MRTSFMLLWMLPALALADDSSAKAHFQAGQAYYEQTDYDNALKEFEESYKQSKRPDLLYDMARCHEALGHTEKAAESFETYLEALPTVPDRMNIEAHIADLRSRRPPNPFHPLPLPVTNWKDTTPPKSKPQRFWSYVVGGLGIGILAAGIATGASAERTYNYISDQCPNHTCNKAFETDLMNERAKGKSLALATDILIPLGAATLGTGIILFGMHR